MLQVRVWDNGYTDHIVVAMPMYIGMDRKAQAANNIICGTKGFETFLDRHSEIWKLYNSLQVNLMFVFTDYLS